MTDLTILACQIDIPATLTRQQRDAHLDSIARKLRSHLQNKHHDLVVLPELSSVDYSRGSFDNLDQLAEPLDGPSFQTFSVLAQEFECAIVYGMPRIGDGVYHISHVAVDEKGRRIGHFDKLHIAQYGASMEKEYFSRGDHLFVFECCGVTIAPIICYDIRIPELTRALAVDHNVELILHCGAYARDESFYSWHHFAVTRALENQLFFLSLNRAGEHYGNSLFCAPWVDENSSGVRFSTNGEEFKTISIDLTEIDRVRKTYTFLDDRLKSYSALEIS